jgi:hypothetical protein
LTPSSTPQSLAIAISSSVQQAGHGFVTQSNTSDQASSYFEIENVILAKEIECI